MKTPAPKKSWLAGWLAKPESAVVRWKAHQAAIREAGNASERAARAHFDCDGAALGKAQRAYVENPSAETAAAWVNAVNFQKAGLMCYDLALQTGLLGYDIETKFDLGLLGEAIAEARQHLEAKQAEVSAAEAALAADVGSTAPEQSPAAKALAQRLEALGRAEGELSKCAGDRVRIALCAGYLDTATREKL